MSRCFCLHICPSLPAPPLPLLNTHQQQQQQERNNNTSQSHHQVEDDPDEGEVLLDDDFENDDTFQTGGGGSSGVPDAEWVADGGGVSTTRHDGSSSSSGAYADYDSVDEECDDVMFDEGFEFDDDESLVDSEQQNSAGAAVEHQEAGADTGSSA